MRINYPTLQETVLEETLENGLKVVLVPKPGFQKTYGLFTTNYGSIDETFVPLGQSEKITVPEGIAHFLEHKLFEKEDGDVFQKFSQLGASANAFTSFTKTSYLFSATENIWENLETLLNFVQEPYFTEKSVNKEKGIIAQEIKMYQDDANWRLFFGVLQNLYPKHPLHIDIAGTVGSIQEITPELLYKCYETFYHPSNMTLLVVGNIDPDSLLAKIKSNQGSKKFPEGKEVKRFFPVENVKDIIAENSLAMDILVPKVALGIKNFAPLKSNPKEQMKDKLVGMFLLEILLGESSAAYLELYDQGLIDDSFGFEFNVERSFSFGDFSGDSHQPQKLVAALKDILFTEKAFKEITEENLSQGKKQMLGKYLQSLNSVEYIANQFFQTSDLKGNLFELPEIIDSITLEDLKKFAKEFLQKENSTVFYLLPKGKEQ